MLQALGDLVYPVMFETGDKPGQDKVYRLEEVLGWVDRLKEVLGQDKVDRLKEVLGWVEGFVAVDKFCAGTSQITIAAIALLATYSTLKVSSTELKSQLRERYKGRSKSNQLTIA